MDLPSRLRAAWEGLWIGCFAWIPTPLGLALRWLAWRWLFAGCGSVRFGTGLSFVGCRHMRLGDAVRLGRGCIITAGDGELVLGDRVSISPYAHVAADGGRIIMGRHVAVGPGTVLRAANHCFSRHDVPILQQGTIRAGSSSGTISGSGPTASSRPTCISAGALWWARAPWSPVMWLPSPSWAVSRHVPSVTATAADARSDRSPGAGVPGVPASPVFFLTGRRCVPSSGSGPQGSPALAAGRGPVPVSFLYGVVPGGANKESAWP